jgi:putative peptidoglycan lipid II flippase
MFLRAGMVSLAFLLASRVLGLLRESALAAAFGATAAGDLAVLMLALPDWVAAVLASGALAYVLLPAWSRLPPPDVAAVQRRVARLLVAGACLLAAALLLLHGAVLAALVPGLPAGAGGAGFHALLWSALALPPALVAALWSARLQHERDFAGLHGGNVMVNGVIVAALGAMAFLPARDGLSLLGPLGLALLVAMGARATLQWSRLRRFRAGAGGTPARAAALPAFPIWGWAAASAGLPLALPFAARSLASHEGAGALATFNYAWKLVELPLVLAIQLVATLALGPIARAWASEPPSPEARVLVRRAVALAWTLACACAAALALAAGGLADLLFGWGRMERGALQHVADWARTASWGLLPQAATAVGLAVLAAQARMRGAALAHGAALLVLLFAAPREGAGLMVWLNLLAAAVCVAVWACLGRTAWAWLPWPALSAAATPLVLVHFAAPLMPQSGTLTQLSAGAAAAGTVLIAAWLISADVRQAVAR